MADQKPEERPTEEEVNLRRQFRTGRLVERPTNDPERLSGPRPERAEQDES